MPQKQEEAERAFAHGSSGATADMAVEGAPSAKDHRSHVPHARKAKPLRENEKPDQLAEKNVRAESHQEALLDEAIEESFPGSDPASPHHVT